MKRILILIDYIFAPKLVYAHCDIPCGIYDPHEAQMAAHTVLRMTRMINELNIDSGKSVESKNVMHQISRLTKVKEDHAEIVKQQIRVIWGDYFKPEHLEKYQDLPDLVFKIMKMASKARQEINEDACG
ncbi:MAG: superoxide dismutase, Ni, partial [Candidatus Portnoybacteria bacterium CG10_big_fil_rev_8_21_14_0_10_36_7]